MDSEQQSPAGLAFLAALALAALVITAGSGHPTDFTQADCVVLDEGELTLHPSGLVGVSLAPALRSGIRPGFEVATLFAVESRDRHFETPWYAISSLVSDASGSTVGVATWLSPHLLAVWSGEGSASLTGWAKSPALRPEQTYIFSANRVATDISTWKPARVRAAAEEPSRACVSVPAQ